MPTFYYLIRLSEILSDTSSFTSATAYFIEIFAQRPVDGDGEESGGGPIGSLAEFTVLRRFTIRLAPPSSLKGNDRSDGLCQVAPINCVFELKKFWAETLLIRLVRYLTHKQKTVSEKAFNEERIEVVTWREAAVGFRTGIRRRSVNACYKWREEAELEQDG